MVLPIWDWWSSFFQASPKKNSGGGRKKEASFRAPERFKPNQLALDSKQWWLCQEIATANKSWLKNLPSPPNFYPLVPVTLRHHAKKEENELCI